MITQDGTVIDRPATAADFKIFGLQLGVLCARNLLQDTESDSIKREAVLARFSAAADQYVVSQKSENGMTEAGERDYRLGFLRGLTSQLLHPNARVEIKHVKATARG